MSIALLLATSGATGVTWTLAVALVAACAFIAFLLEINDEQAKDVRENRNESIRLEYDNADLRAELDAINNPFLAVDLADIDPDHPGWQRLYDAVLEQASDDATWDEAAHRRHQAEQIERAQWTPEETALGEQVDAMFEGGEAL